MINIKFFSKTSDGKTFVIWFNGNCTVCAFDVHGGYLSTIWRIGHLREYICISLMVTFLQPLGEEKITMDKYDCDVVYLWNHRQVLRRIYAQSLHSVLPCTSAYENY